MRLSTYDKIEATTGQDPFKLLNSDRFKGVEDLEAAADKLSELTGEQITVKPLTLDKMIRKGLEDNQIIKDDQCVSWVDLEPKPRGRRIKLSMRELLEAHFNGRSVWDIFRKDLSSIANTVDAAEQISVITGGKIKTSPVTVQKTIQRGLDSDEIKPGEFFTKWYKTRKKKNKNETPKVEVEKTAVNLECRECGYHSREAMPVSPTMDFCVKGRRCSSCNKWQTYIVSGMYKGIKFKKALDTESKVEEFVNSDLKTIPNPFEEVKIND